MIYFENCVDFTFLLFIVFIVLQEGQAIEHSSEDRDPGHGFEGNCYILLRITDVMYRCLKEDLIYFENCVDFTFLLFIVFIVVGELLAETRAN